MYNQFLTAALLLISINVAFAQNSSPDELYPQVSGSYTGMHVAQSPDPLISYLWENPKATDDLEIYTIKPVSVLSDKPSFSDIRNITSIKVSGGCNLMFDFGQVNAAWFEFDSDDLDGDIEMSISEFNEPAVFNLGSQHPVKTSKPVRYGNTWRLELNKELYEGVRFAWIHIHQLDEPATITSPRLICQIKPTNYEGSFSCSDTMLTRIWYTGAYDVKLNLLKDYFGAILMERSDRHSWTGDAHTSQAASMVAFGNYDFVKTNLNYTSTQFNGIASYSLYWVLSLIDYYYYTGDKILLDELLENACAKLDIAYDHYGTNPKIAFYGWDERLGAGFENPTTEAQNAYKMLSIQTWKQFGEIMKLTGYTELSEKYNGYAEEKINLLREDKAWMESYGVHAVADAVNAGFATTEETSKLWQTALSDRLQRMSYSPFNQFFIIRAMANLNRYNEALSTIDDCWGGQIRYGGTTFFEVFRSSWNDISLQPNDAPVNNQCGYTSLTHPWSAGVTKWLSEEVLGIKPISPGFSTFIIKPHLSHSVTWVRGCTPTLHGKIEASFDLESGKCEITIPQGTKATLCIPKAGLKIEKVQFIGKQYKKGKEDNDFIYYPDLPAGKYKIDIKYAGKLIKPDEEPTIYTYSPPTEDIKTKGNWQGNYGSKGYILCSYDSLENRISIPDFMEQPVFNLNGSIHWENGTSDIRALEDLNGKRNIGALITRDPEVCRQTMTIDLPCKIKKSYKVSLYFVDWDTSERRSAIEIFDLDNKELLAPVYMVRNYSGGKYITYEFDRSVRIRINHVRGINAAVSGIFFD